MNYWIKNATLVNEGQTFEANVFALSLKVLYIDIKTKCGLGHRNGNLHIEILAASDEVTVPSYVHADIEISGSCHVCNGISHLRNDDVASALDACGNLYFQGLALAHGTVSPAVGARI